jgi:hypothetical protein
VTAPKLAFEVDEFLRDFLSDGAKPTHAISAVGGTCGFSDRQLRLAAVRLGIVREGSPKARVWSLSATSPETPPDTSPGSLPRGSGAVIRRGGSLPFGKEREPLSGDPASPAEETYLGKFQTKGPFYFVPFGALGGRTKRFRCHRPHKGKMEWPDGFEGLVSRPGCSKEWMATGQARDQAMYWRYTGNDPAPDVVPCTVGLCVDCLWALGDAGRLVRIPDDPDEPKETRGWYAATCGICDPAAASRAALNLPTPPSGYPTGTTFAWFGPATGWVAGVEGDSGWVALPPSDEQVAAFLR